jgi:ComF family protein
MSAATQTSLLPRLSRLALDLLYPPRCALCHRHGDFLCNACRDALPRADGDRCPKCWLPWDRHFCVACADQPIAFSLRSPYRYEGDVRTLVHAFKFGNFSSLAASLALPMVLAIESLPPPDVIVPVPLSGRHERQRGYNQALLLARGLGQFSRAPVVNVLKRTTQGKAQSLTNDAALRRANVRNAFAVAKRADIADRHVLLVDDVATTGATLDACAQVLLDAGASKVSAVTFARED